MAVVTYPSVTGKLRPSGMSRVVYCAGSFGLAGLYPQPDGPEQREGTAAHFYVTEGLEGRDVKVGDVAPNGHPIDQPMVTNGQLYLDDVRAVLRTYGVFSGAEAAGFLHERRIAFRIETMVFAHQTIHPDNEGTPDTYLLDVPGKRLIVWDYKYGHRYVDAYMNWQLINYVAAIFESYGITREEAFGFTISLRVIQPRNYHAAGPVREWVVSGAVIWTYFDTLRAAAYAAKVPGAPTSTGEWCRDCEGRHACEAFMRIAARAMDTAGESVPIDLPLPAVGLELSRLHRAADIIKARIDGLEAIALDAIAKGHAVPGWKKGFVDSKERFRDDASALAFGDLMGADFRKADTITPNQARQKLVALGFDKDTAAALIEPYAFKPTGASRLTPAGPNDAAKAFT